MRAGAVLVIPALEKGRGGGHLVRSLTLVRSLRSLGGEAYLYLAVKPGENAGEYREGITNLALPLEAAWILDTGQKPEEKEWALIIVDRFKTSPEELRIWSAWGPLLGLDEGGPGREGFDFLLDLLPGLPGRALPNNAAPELLPLPKTRRPSFFTARYAGEGPVSGGIPAPLKVLVSFGAEDPAGLSLPAARALINPPITEITLLLGGLNKDAAPPEQPGLRVLRNPGELRERLAGYDLVVTHFGLTAFEALHARVPVLLVAPGPYHKKLGQRGGFISAGTGKKGANRLGRFLYTKDRLDREKLGRIAAACETASRRHRLDGERRVDLSALLFGFTPILPSACPVCGTGERLNHRVLARFPHRTYRLCPHCGMVYMLRLSKPPIEYGTDYFFGAYKEQYGKTYLEDFPSLADRGKKRLRRILSLLPQKEERLPRRLLDLGCAYGPFLAAARDLGFSPVGMDAAEDALRYVREKLGFPAFQGFFPESPLEFQERSFEVITLWYVIEHFEDPRRALTEINRLLKPGGLIAFATPSYEGISRFSSRKKFLKKSPSDHWTVWSPRRCGKTLAAFGFTVKKILVTGHHPERFPLIGPFLTKRTGLLYNFFYWISVIFGLGDTFEVYALKNEEGASASKKN
ncbi:MAG: class I SAM-dependent methyltransferase [Spirochaetaceae bacterium]|jgi:2-polyprenyl-3-methyl-5-hydroxy-6-metoxy-1,4-benzoquinol methylase|nr:class I SAM-dependent methyltransferase [Spirochaetaceae bacterium]